MVLVGFQLGVFRLGLRLALCGLSASKTDGDWKKAPRNGPLSCAPHIHTCTHARTHTQVGIPTWINEKSE